MREPYIVLGSWKFIKFKIILFFSEADEYGMEEGTEGWMMVKKENENAAVGTTVSLITVTFLFTLIF